MILILIFINKCCVAKDGKKVFPKLANISLYIMSLIPIANTVAIGVGILLLIVLIDDLPIKLKKGTKFYSKWLSRD
jgi:hypothetical protein